MKKLFGWSIAALTVSFALAAGTSRTSAAPMSELQAAPAAALQTTCPAGDHACNKCNGGGQYCTCEHCACPDCAVQ